MYRLFAFTLIAGFLASAATSVTLVEPALAHPSRSAPVTSQAARPAPRVQAGAAADQVAHPTLALPRVSIGPKPAAAPRLVNPDMATLPHPCAAAVHGIVGPECPSK